MTWKVYHEDEKTALARDRIRTSYLPIFEGHLYLVEKIGALTGTVVWQQVVFVPPTHQHPPRLPPVPLV